MMCSMRKGAHLMADVSSGGFLCGKHKENCLVTITDGRAQVKRFLLHFCDAKNLLKIGEAENSGPL